MAVISQKREPIKEMTFGQKHNDLLKIDFFSEYVPALRDHY